MILGVGTDITRIRRIEVALVNGREAFKNRVFTEREQERASASLMPGAVYARRWAAKEACMKAMAIGQAMGVAWTEIEVTGPKGEQPSIILHGAAQERLKELTPQGMQARVHLSLSDDPPFAMAFVVIDAERIL